MDETIPLLQRALLMPVPLTAGSGTRFKVLESLAAGLPVVSTAKGVEGLELISGIHYFAAESPAQFVEAALDLRDDPDRWEAIVAEGLRVIEAKFSPEVLKQAIFDVLETLLPA